MHKHNLKTLQKVKRTFEQTWNATLKSKLSIEKRLKFFYFSNDSLIIKGVKNTEKRSELTFGFLFKLIKIT